MINDNDRNGILLFIIIYIMITLIFLIFFKKIYNYITSTSSSIFGIGLSANSS